MTGRVALGQGIVEYGLILALTALLTIAALTLGGDAIAAFLAAVQEAIGPS
jgi:Flp pilus assembly pilin Flp